MLSTLLRIVLAGQLKPFCLSSKEKPHFDTSIESFGLYVHIPFAVRSARSVPITSACIVKIR